MMPNTKHHYQRVDLENGYLQATRDDTDELQDFRINAYLKDGSLVKSGRYQYNLQYDYMREQIWKNGVLIKDEISICGHSYGHLQWEHSEGGMRPDWDNPYPDNYEPVKPEGTKMFHEEGILYPFFCIEFNVRAYLNFDIWEDLQDWRKPRRNLITGVHLMDPRDIRKIDGDDLETQKNFDPKKAREKRINAIKQYSQYFRCEGDEEYLESIKANHEKDLDIEVPMDPRFID